MTDLVSSLSSALDKREELAKAAHDPAGWRFPRYEACWDGGFEADDNILDFIAANDPSWVLRDCEAKRRVLERHRPYWFTGEATAGSEQYCDRCSDGGEYDWPCPEVRDLAYALGVEVPE